MTIGTLDIKDRFERTIRAEVFDVPNVVNHRGIEHVVTHAIITWEWVARTGGYTHRDVGLFVRRVLKSGVVSETTTRHHIYGDHMPEWLAEFVASYTPEEYRAAIRENRRINDAYEIIAEEIK